MPTVFVYGGLMAQPRVLAQGRAAVAPGYRTRFSVRGLRWIEPRFLGLEEAPEEQAHGVVFDIDAEEWAQMIRHELSYVPTPIEVWVAGEAKEAVALVLRPEKRHPEGVPSARYAAQLRAGAAYHGLPAEVVAYYAALERTGNRITRVLAVFAPLVRVLVPWLGLKGAAALTLSLIVGLPVGFLALWWFR